MDTQTLPVTESPKILDEIIRRLAPRREQEVREGLRTLNLQRLTRGLQVQESKQMAYLLSWIFLLDHPFPQRKQMLVEFLLTNWQRCASEPSRWGVPDSFSDKRLIDVYLELADHFKVTWLRYSADSTQSNFIRFDRMPFHSSIVRSFSPLYRIAASIGLFKLKQGARANSLTFKLPDDVVTVLERCESARVLAYTFFEAINDQKMPYLSVIYLSTPTSDGPELTISVNGHAIAITSSKSKRLHIDRSALEIQPIPIDLTGPIRSSLKETTHVYVDFTGVPFPVHPDHGEHQEYKLPYVSFYLAEELSIEKLRAILETRPFITTPRYMEVIRKHLGRTTYSEQEQQAFLSKIACVYSKAIEDDEEDSDICSVDELIHLEASLSRQRISIPVRSETCRHFNRSMDLSEYLHYYRDTNAWNCIICNEKANFAKLHIDALALLLLSIPELKQNTVRLNPVTGEIHSPDPNVPAQDDMEFSGWE
ncbi:MIZ/SP-RING zinc finger domain-containing protein [Giardia muris]|uniref:MIZ/SP-RING zinc finger domain-containing protein n=1 Tax=Giardia muris TaxID=5742 RepID=A0A4Z1SMC6_GIAMU|nr:MIZ/SP-RING zinc finger domain-containing protein [Giardia muris]|eukprot:TNJ26836.1 MIZ/SP-RING zinc finger domain-containing protein [Giardia muris]